jgi:serine/threonine protein kinase
MNFYIVNPGHRRQSLAISLASKLGRGATATVYQVQSDKKLYAAKIYHQDQNFDREKILAMLDVQPENREVVHNGQEYPQFAWPLAIIENDRGDGVGFLLPLVDIHDSFTLDHYYDKGLFKKLNSPDEGALSYKLEIARNLAQIVTELHRIGHYFIDCKPQNIRVFKRSHLVTLIDCDGFSINGKFKRYPAELLSTDYIAPEVHRRHALPSTLGEPQDRYALAVIIFQLLNQGTHPFQGIASDLNSPFNTNDEKAAAGLYPHGFIENSEIKPRPQSIHHLWDAETRRLFDQAFTTSSPTSRPSAKEWANHFEKLLFSKSLVRCKRILNNLDHIRFRDMDCPACYLENLPAFKPEMKPVQVFDSTSSAFNNKNLSHNTLPPTTSKKNSESHITFIIIGVVILYVVILLFTSSNKNSQVTEPSVSLPAPTSDVPRSQANLSFEGKINLLATSTKALNNEVIFELFNDQDNLQTFANDVTDDILKKFKSVKDVANDGNLITYKIDGLHPIKTIKFVGSFESGCKDSNGIAQVCYVETASEVICKRSEDDMADKFKSLCLYSISR